MKPDLALRWTGGSGLAASILLMATGPLYASMGPPPALADGDALVAYLVASQSLAVTTKLIDALFCLGLVVFAAGLRHLLGRAGDEHDWLASLTFGLALIAATVILVGDVMGAAAALAAYDRPDVSAVRGLSLGSLPAFGAIGLIFVAAFLVAAGGALLVTRALPRWIGWSGVLAGAINAAAAPTIYGGGDYLYASIAAGGSVGLYSYAIMVAGLVFTIWIGIVGIAMMWGSRTRPRAGSQS